MLNSHFASQQIMDLFADGDRYERIKVDGDILR